VLHRLGLGLIATLLCTTPAMADPTAIAPSRPLAMGTLRGDPNLWPSAAVVGVAGGAWLSLELFAPKPATCRWCENNGLDRETSLAWRSVPEDKAEFLSNLFAFGLLPVGLASAATASAYQSGAPAYGERMLQNTTYSAEAVAIAGLFNQLTKLLVARERPPGNVERSDHAMSFYSGHTSFAFSLATSMATLSSLRREPLAPLVWSVGLPLATLVGLFRVIAGRHHLTDVLVGATVGSLIGVAAPMMLHPSR
jgi:PAP2 superfamily